MNQIIHHDVKDVIPRIQALMLAFGWQGGTVWQIAEETGCDAHDLIYKASEEYNSSHRAGWFSYCTNSLEYNQEKIAPAMKGNLQFWIGVASGVQTNLKLKKETPKKF